MGKKNFATRGLSLSELVLLGKIFLKFLQIYYEAKAQSKKEAFDATLASASFARALHEYRGHVTKDSASAVSLDELEDDLLSTPQIADEKSTEISQASHNTPPPLPQNKGRSEKVEPDES